MSVEDGVIFNDITWRCVDCSKLYNNLDGVGEDRHCFCGGRLLPVVVSTCELSSSSPYFSDVEYPTVSC